MILALDIGGTSLRAALVLNGKVLERRQASTPQPATPARVLAAITALSSPLVEWATAVGVACAGAVTQGTVNATADHTFPEWQDVPLASQLVAVFNRPTVVLNDARAAAWGESNVGAGHGLSEFMFVTISTGVGAGLILGHRLHLAQNGLDAELGFTFLPALEGQGFNCPPLGHLEALEHQASGTALGRAARRLGLADARALADAAEADDVQAQAAYGRAAAQIAWKAADVAALLGISRVALGGSIGLRRSFQHLVNASLTHFPTQFQPEIVPAALGADAGLIGAAIWATRDALSDHERHQTKT